jgi:hypothetical protein
MGTTEDEPTPDLADVLQDEQPPAGLAVLVRQEGTVYTRERPTRAGGARTELLQTSPESIAGADPRRKRLLICPVDGAIYIGTDRSSVNAGSAARWPQGVVLELFHHDQVYAAAVTGTVITAVIVEQWAD